ncbi:MAG: hypothetical protein GY754_38045 [bacterium]|nr:hypothetical protein [bacterium]
MRKYFCIQTLFFGLTLLIAALSPLLTGCGSGFSGDSLTSPVINSFNAETKTLFLDRNILSTKLEVDASDDGSIRSFSFEIVSDPTGGSLSGNDTALGKIYTTGGSSTGVVKIKVTVTDNDGTSSEQELSITVTKSIYRINDTEGGFSGSLDDSDCFGFSSDNIGDLDGDGVIDIAVSAYLDNDGGTDTGAVYILFLNKDGSVKKDQKISSEKGNFSGTLDAEDRFGISVAGIGDLDGDGVVDIAVGADRDDDGSTNTGAVWILFLNADGTVKSHQKISATEGGSPSGGLPEWEAGNSFGSSVEGLGDHDGDGIPDLAVGAHLENNGNSNEGAVFILFLNRNGTIKNHYKIIDTSPNLILSLEGGDYFGNSVASLGDLNNDGIGDIAVGAFGDNNSGPDGIGDADAGAVYIIFLNSDGSVKDVTGSGVGYQVMTQGNNIIGSLLSPSDSFGVAVENIGDIDGDGVVDLAVGVEGDDDGLPNSGSVYIFFMNSDGTMKSFQKICNDSGNFSNSSDNHTISALEFFGRSILSLGDLDGDGVEDIGVGAYNFDNGNTDSGTLWMLHLKSDGSIVSN